LLGKYANATWLLAENFTVVDMSGNALAVNLSGVVDSALAVSNFNGDGVAPVLVNSSLDMSRGALELVFSETVALGSLNAVKVRIQGAAGSATHSLTLSGGQFTLRDYTFVTIALTASDLNALKTDRLVATASSNTYVTLMSAAITDTSGNAIVAITQNVGLFVADAVAPEVVSFDLDMSGLTMTLTFTETVDVSSLDVQGLMLVSSQAVGALSYALTSGSSGVTSGNGPIVNVSIGVGDANTIKGLVGLAVDANTTLLAVTAGSVRDMNGNNVLGRAAANALNVGRYIANRVRPNLERFAVDVNATKLILNFDQPVNASTLNFSAIVLIGRTSASRLRLTGGSSDSSIGQQITVVLSVGDANAMKENEQLYVDLNSSKLAIEDSLIRDLAGNAVNGIAEATPLRATLYIQDTNRPVLLAFSLNMSSGVLVLSFDETVRVSTVNVGALSLQSGSSSVGNNSRVTLSQGSSGVRQTVNKAEVVVVIGRQDMNALKYAGIGRDGATSWLAASSGLAQSMNGDAVVERLDGVNALNVAAFEGDRVEPVIERFSVSLTGEVLVLGFSEVVQAFSVDVNKLTLQSMQSYVGGSSVKYTLSSMSSRVLTTMNSENVTIALGLDDLNAMKYLVPLATSAGTTFLSAQLGVAVDMTGNAVVAISSGTGLVVSGYEQDAVAPVLTGFDLDMNEPGVVTLRFSETMNASSLVVGALVLVNSGSNGTAVYALTGGVVSQNNSDVVTVTMNEQDINAIKSLRTVGVDRNNSFLSLMAGGVKDMRGNDVVGIGADAALQVSSFTGDHTQPMLRSFQFDLNNGVISLSFSKTVDPRSVVLSGIGIQDGVTGSVFVQLSGGAVWMEFGPVVRVNLSVGDLNEIKRVQPFSGAYHNETFVTLSAQAVKDLAGNAVVAVVDGAAVRCETFGRDVTRPQLVAFDLDMSVGRLVVYLTETVNADSLNVSSILFAASSSSSESRVPCLSCHVVSNNSDILVLTVPVAVLNRLKFTGSIGLSENSTYVVFDSNAVADMSGNYYGESFAVVKVTHLVVDMVAPVLDSFEVDMDSGILTLTFVEPVVASTLNISGLALSDGSQLQSFVIVGAVGLVAQFNTSIGIVITDDLNDNLLLASRNLPNVLICEPRHADPVSLVFYKKVLITKPALAKIEEMLA